MKYFPNVDCGIVVFQVNLVLVQILMVGLAWYLSFQWSVQSVTVPQKCPHRQPQQIKVDHLLWTRRVVCVPFFGDWWGLWITVIILHHEHAMYIKAGILQPSEYYFGSRGWGWAIESWREIEKTYKMKTILIWIQATRARTVMALLMRQSVLTVHGQKKDSPLFWGFSLLWIKFVDCIFVDCLWLLPVVLYYKTLNSISRNVVISSFEKRYLDRDFTNFAQIFRVAKAQLGKCFKRWNLAQGKLPQIWTGKTLKIPATN